MTKFGSEVSACLSGSSALVTAIEKFPLRSSPQGVPGTGSPPVSISHSASPSTLGFTQVNLRYVFIRYAFISGDGKWSPLGEEAANGHMHVRNCKTRWQMCPLSYEHPGSEGRRGGNCCLLGVGSEGSLRTRSIPEYL